MNSQEFILDMIEDTKQTIAQEKAFNRYIRNLRILSIVVEVITLYIMSKQINITKEPTALNIICIAFVTSLIVSCIQDEIKRTLTFNYEQQRLHDKVREFQEILDLQESFK